eukprot:4820702-Amphidinium_carterae.2
MAFGLRSLQWLRRGWRLLLVECLPLRARPPGADHAEHRRDDLLVRVAEAVDTWGESRRNRRLLASSACSVVSGCGDAHQRQRGLSSPLTVHMNVSQSRHTARMQ